MEIISISNPVYAKADHSQINCTLETDKGTFEFTASAADPELHGQAAYSSLIAGEWGAISAYVAPAGPSIKEQIFALEMTITTRRLREATLGIDSGWLLSINNQIAALRAQI
jgi:hypothetical protein